MDGTSLLRELAGRVASEKEETETFYLPAMLETSHKSIKLRENENLFPSRLKDHRLYLKNGAGQELGYLSFPDDRFYYIVIPLFEQRKVLVKIRAAKGKDAGRKKSSARYHRLHLWVRFSSGDGKQMPENLNLQIQLLLEKYRNSDEISSHDLQLVHINTVFHTPMVYPAAAFLEIHPLYIFHL